MALRAIAITLAMAVAGVGYAQTSDAPPSPQGVPSAPQATSPVPPWNSPAETALQMPVDGPPQTDSLAQSFRSSGAFAAATVLAVRPAAALLTFEDSPKLHGGFLSWTAAAQGEIGYRRADDTSWLVAMQVVPVAGAATVLGLDLDRISTNHSSKPDHEWRWEVGVRMMAIAAPDAFFVLGIGPHGGVVWQCPLEKSRLHLRDFTLDARADIGLLFTGVGVPYLDIRDEAGLTYHPREFPGLSISAGGYQEWASFILATAGTPGVYLRLGWNF